VRGVEVADEWLAEGIWTFPFTDGDLDLADVVFGGGVRLCGDTALFVSAGTPSTDSSRGGTATRTTYPILFRAS